MAHDLALHTARLLADGYCILPDACDPDTIAALDRDCDPRFEATPFCQGGFYGARTKRFGALQVLRGIDLAIRPGRVTALVGPNGAGKTTLIKCILGLTRADAGEIYVGAARVGDDPSYRTRIGYMPQIARFPDNLTAAELIAMVSDVSPNGW